ncbi:MAG: hypothetical protein JWO86_1878 [Myxococcaceae bacterium]|jgi:hypothetical protein|nr:hypothetical protein [Myxococcaceae bacterium]MEA2747491.1 hypothetical protein [Myxococcales bacterium]
MGARGSLGIQRGEARGLHEPLVAMSASPFVRTEVRPDRSSDAPIAVDIGGIDTARTNRPSWASRIPQAWIGMSGYLIAGVFLGLVLIVALGFTRGDSNKAAASPGLVTDNVVHLKATQLGAQCWKGVEDDGPARVTVSLEVGLDGKVRNARAAGESPALRACIESHVKAWEFLPQANPSQMVLPFEIDQP